MDQELHALFAERFVRNESRIYWYIFSLLPRRSEAEELFQETSLTLWKTWDRYDPKVEFVSWAWGIAQNLVRNHLRKRKNQPCLLLDDQVLEQLAERRLLEDGVLEERRRILRSCLEKLPERQRHLVEKIYGGERSVKAIAGETEQTPNAVYKHLRRIRALLSDCIDRQVAPGGAT